MTRLERERPANKAGRAEGAVRATGHHHPSITTRRPIAAARGRLKRAIIGAYIAGALTLPATQAMMLLAGGLRDD